MNVNTTDVVLVGGGLGNSLLAKFITAKHPSLRLHIFDANKDVTPDKTWSFHLSDVEGMLSTIQPLITKQWDSYDVFFPRFHKTIPLAYASVRPETLRQHLKEFTQIHFHFDHKVLDIKPNAIKDKNNFLHLNKITFDGTGTLTNTQNGYQKFLGLHVKLKQAHNLKRPILMDARIPQQDGYRFMYVLPWSEDELLVEETHYSTSPHIPLELYESEILKYIKQQGWELDHVQGREADSLAIPLSLPCVPEGSIKVGVRGHFFHPVTGYSFPYAAQVAKEISNLNELNPKTVQTKILELNKGKQTQQDFFLLLNRLMFHSAKPDQRYRIFEHFYAMPLGFIQRFYRGDMTFFDRLRIFIGKPPVPIAAALKVFLSPKDIQ